MSLQFQMARYSAGTGDCPGSPKSVRIVVVGDKGTGKSSLIVAAATDSFPPNVPPVLPDTKLPFEFFPDGVPVTIVDTSSRYIYCFDMKKAVPTAHHCCLIYLLDKDT